MDGSPRGCRRLAGQCWVQVVTLESLHIEHPDPTSVMARPHCLDAQVEVRPAREPALVVRVKGPSGRDEIR